MGGITARMSRSDSKCLLRCAQRIPYRVVQYRQVVLLHISLFIQEISRAVFFEKYHSPDESSLYSISLIKIFLLRKEKRP
jgi:hypothetical protein